MHQVGAFEAKTHLPELLERVRGGERIVITKHGMPVAELVPVSKTGKPDLKKLYKEMTAFRNGRRLGKDSIRNLMEEGRRF